MYIIRSETIGVGIGYWRWGGESGGCWEIHFGPWVILFCKKEDLP